MSRPARGLALLLATVLLLAPVVPFAAVGGAAAAPAGMSTIPDANVAEDVPAGETIPLSASELEGGVMASQHADSLSVTLTTADHAASVMDADSAVVSGDGMAVVLRDDQQSAGREVALDAGRLQQALGYRPEAIYGTHEDGSEWTATAEYVDGYLVFDVPHFSSNTVTFSGEVTVDATGATNGTQFSYTLSGGSVSNGSLTFIGDTNNETETRSWSSPGTKSVTVAGSSVSDATVSASAPQESTTDTGKNYASLTSVGDIDGDGGGEIAYVSNGNDVDFYDPEDGSATDTGQDTDTTVSTGDVDGDGVAEIVFDQKGGALYYYDSVNGHVDTGMSSDGATKTGDVDGDGIDEIIYRDGSGNLDYYDADDGSNSGTGQSASDIAAGDVDGDGTDEIIYRDGSGNLDYYDADDGSNSGTGQSASDIAAGDVDGDGTDEIIYRDGNENLFYYDIGDNANVDTGFGARAVASGDLDGDDMDEIVYKDGGNNIDYYDVADSVNTETGGSSYSTPSAGDINGDGIDEIAYSTPGEKLRYYSPGGPASVDFDVDNDGVTDTTIHVPGGGTESASLSGLTTSTDTIAISANASITSATLTYTEITKTENPALKIDSDAGAQTITHAGTLADGETIDLSSEINESAIGGTVDLTTTVTNPVNAAEGQVSMEFSHAAQAKISTTYQASTFTESYNISHTYADATNNTQVTIPFVSSRVVGVKNVEYRVDGGSWDRVAPANYRLDGTTLDVYLDDATGGVSAGQTVDVRATGRKISVDNGKVTVTDPTAPGEELDSELRIDSRQSDFAVNVGPTDDGDRVHYAYSNNFPTEDYVVIQSNGDQDLHLPNAVTGDRFRVRHLDTRVVAERGDVRIDVVKAGENPELDVSPGPGGAGDPVTVEYYNTETGVKYLLNSLTRSIVVDSDVAESPAIFEDDDSEDTWAILTDSGPSGTSSSSGAVGQFTERASGAVGSVSLPVDGSGLGQLALVGVLGLGGLLVLRRFNPFGGSSDSAAVTSSTSTGSASASAVSRLTGLASTAGAATSRAAQTTGSGVLAALRRLLAYFGQVATLILGNRRASITAGVVAAIVAARVGLVSLPEGTGILIVVAGVPVATWLILRQNNAASTRVWLGSTIAAVILGLEFVAPGTVQTAIEQLTSETVAPLLILVAAGGLYLWYRARQSDRPQIIIGGDSE